MIELKDDNFQTEVLDSDQLVLVKIWDTLCMPCKTLNPIYETLEKEFEDVKFTSAQYSEFPTAASSYGVRGIPTILFIKGGELIEKISGLNTEEKIREKVKNAL